MDFKYPSREELLGCRLLLGCPVFDRLLNLSYFVNDGSVRGSQFGGLLEVLESLFFLLHTGVGDGATVVGLGLVSVLGLSIGRNFNCVTSPSLTVPVLPQFAGEQGGVGVQSETKCPHLAIQLLGVLFTRLRELVQITQALLVLIKAESDVTGFEGCITKVLELRRNLKAHWRTEFLALVIVGEILIRVAGGIRDLFVRIIVRLAGEFTTVDNGYVRGRLVALGGYVLNLANHALSVDHFTKNHVLAIEMRGGDGRDEELAAIGTGTGVGHGKKERTVMLEVEVLVGEFLAVDRLAASPVKGSEITTLDHELLNHTVENRT